MAKELPKRSEVKEEFTWKIEDVFPDIAAWEAENPLEMRRDKGLTPQMIMEHINANFSDGIYVTDVHAGSAARNNGVLPGDILIAFNNTEVTELQALQQLLELARELDIPIEFSANGVLYLTEHSLQQQQGTSFHQNVKGDRSYQKTKNS